MKLNKITLLFAAVMSGVLAGQNAGATTLLIEQFSGYATGDLGSPGTGNTGSVPGWNNPNASITVTNGSHSLDGTGLGLVSSAGDKVTISATAGLSVYNKFANPSNFPQTTQTNIYYSFLYRFNVGTDVTNGQVVMQVVRQNSSTAVDLQLFAKNAGGANVQLGIAKPLGSSTNYAPNIIAAGQTVFVVVREQIIPGTTNDIDDLWINPPPGSFGTNEANVPPVSATTSDGTEDQSTTGPGRFYVGSGASANLDELRIATSWAEVTPPVGQCINASITADPTNVTQVAEISATFSATATGTSPTYQWQISKNSGSTFSNIVGATTAIYTTPNLVLATDNGNQYRMIVSVPCNSTSATSAVATVSLTAPIVTPPGLVMYDTFADQIRDNTPVTTNNSVWRTSVSADLSAFPGPGMVGLPVSGGSSLWLGYFTDITDTNVPPVDLAVGTTMKVTLPFIPASYNSFTNNGTMRFCVYDYADGGTPLTEDSTAAGGSTGNGAGVRGYMLSLDFGPTFAANSPLSLLVRNGVGDINLMGTTGDYLSMGSGPSGGGFTGMPAFQAGTTYTLVLSVSRTDVNSIDLTAAISGGGTNWSFTATETNFAYHRFDSFGIRPSSLETTADQFTFPTFEVEVDQNAVSVTPFPLSIQHSSANAVVLTWTSVPTAQYDIQSTASLNPTSWITNATVTASGTSTSYTNTPLSGSSRFFRVVSP
ncbi:MAG TPA: hypothetical protein VN048_01800 [Verrucomicrobiae bacterium]|nr:hypothetical protein [Verrucomicrobiae bacterium]